MEDDYGEVDKGEEFDEGHDMIIDEDFAEAGKEDNAEERAQAEHQAEMDAKSDHEAQMSAQAEAEAQAQFENEPKPNDLTSMFADFDMKLKAIAETLQGQIEEIRQRIEMLEKNPKLFDMDVKI